MLARVEIHSDVSLLLNDTSIVFGGYEFHLKDYINYYIMVTHTDN